MPDPSAITMGDLLGKNAPALSATSDFPEVKAPPADTASEENSAAAPAADADEGKSSQEPDAPAASEPSQPDPGAERPPARGVQKRIDELTARGRDAERRADGLQDQLSTALKTIEQITGKDAKSEADKVETADPRPKRETFDNPDAYDEALIEWSTRAATRVAETQQREKDATARTNQEIEELRTTWTERVTKAREDHADFDEVVTNPALQITPAMSQALCYADNGGEVAYHLGKNPDEAARIAKLPQGRQVFEISKLAASLVRKPNVSRVPPPVKPIGAINGKATAKTPDEMDMNEYAAQHPLTKQHNDALARTRRGATAH